ncbi:MAG: DUF4381 domain-containing protein [Cereibacter sphaeroides]|uniref:DUF4381 domain-containing protein n=1 Tax=Cereibacter sphaeroides TaxID=1063 RepID=A0A2W5SB79_CERSP|nr:MAG: DUF4381 domain-containing protein [Cereibacter sphaeroides]
MNGDESLILLLDQLHDIVEPPAVSMWPATPAWAVVGLILLTMVGFALRALLKHRRATAYRRAALAELQRIAPDLRAGQPAALAEVNPLLRRTALVGFQRADVAGLTGADWIAFLNRTGGGFAPFAAALSAGPYSSRPPAFDGAALVVATDQWIRYHHD